LDGTEYLVRFGSSDRRITSLTLYVDEAGQSPADERADAVFLFWNVSVKTGLFTGQASWSLVKFEYLAADWYKVDHGPSAVSEVTDR
jgi:hypothetical protein